MVVCFIILIGMAALLCLSAAVSLPEDISPPKGQAAFYKAAYYLLMLEQGKRGLAGKRTSGKGVSEKRVSGERAGCDKAWMPVGEKGTVQTSARIMFETARLARVLLVLFLGSGLSLLLQAALAGQSVLESGYELLRPTDGQDAWSWELQAQIGETAQTEQLEVTVSKRRYTEKEKQELLEQAIGEIDRIILGDNASVDEVRGRVVLPSEVLDGVVSIQWIQDPMDLLDADGNVTEDLPEEGTLLQLKALLDCDGRAAIYECALQLYPPLYSDEEKLRRALQNEVEKADEQSAEEATLHLPEELNGQKIIWEAKETDTAAICLGLTLLAAVCAWIAQNQERQKAQEQRRRQMLMDYPDLLFKLSMLLNAGLTMQNAFFKIALEYRNRETKDVHYAYEEMLTSYYEMQSGVPEARSYENFGRRCGVGSYNKLGTMLSANLQKGSQGLAKLLQEEAVFSMEERSQMARKFGEEAGTKLVLPMILMLLVVLVILVAPAVMSF